MRPLDVIPDRGCPGWQSEHLDHFSHSCHWAGSVPRSGPSVDVVEPGVEPGVDVVEPD